ncbi:MAG: TetR/AcrR family transcriptional regulator [Deltaproteobacteria bacterium]|nr:TetR/AcrR family transcriptional regulator [Deltaproteobacteria bacterium]
MAPMIKDPAVQKRRNRERDEIAFDILEAGKEVLIDEGPERFSMRKVASTVKLSVGTIYHYFSDKEALLSQVVTDSFVLLDRRIEEASNRKRGLRGLIDAYWQFGLEFPGEYYLLFLSQPPLLEKVDAPNANPLDLLRKGLEENAPFLVEHFSEKALTDAFWASIHGAVALANNCRNFSPARAEAMKAALTEVLLRGLSTPEVAPETLFTTAKEPQKP